MQDELIRTYLEKARSGRIVAFDTETTGLTGNDEICQIAAVEYVGGVKGRALNEYLRISFPMPWYAEEVHGISDAFLKERGVPASRGLRKFLDLLGDDALLVAHNAKFDIRMFNGCCCKHHLRRLPHDVPVCDTWNLAKTVVPGLENYQLSTLIDELNVRGKNSHRAQDDAAACAGVFFKLMDKVSKRK